MSAEMQKATFLCQLALSGAPTCLGEWKACCFKGVAPPASADLHGDASSLFFYLVTSFSPAGSSMRTGDILPIDSYTSVLGTQRIRSPDAQWVTRRYGPAYSPMQYSQWLKSTSKDLSLPLQKKLTGQGSQHQVNTAVTQLKARPPVLKPWMAQLWRLNEVNHVKGWWWLPAPTKHSVILVNINSLKRAKFSPYPSCLSLPHPLSPPQRNLEHI